MIFPDFCIIKRLGTYLPFCGECQSIIIKFTAFWRVSLWLVGNRQFIVFLSRNTTQRFSKGYNMRRYAVPIEQTNWLPGLHPHRLSWEVKHPITIRSNLKFRVGLFFFFTIVNGPGTLLPLTVNIWKSHIWTADKEVNMKTIFAVMNTTWAVVKIRPYFCTGIAEVMGSKAVQAWIFSRPYFHCCSSGVYYREDRFHIHYFLCNFAIFILLI